MLVAIRFVATALMCMVSATALAAPALQVQLEELAQRAQPGIFSIAVLDLRSGANWGVQADRFMIMMSDFKAPVAAAVLSRIDAGSLNLEQKVTLQRADIVAGSAVPSIGANFQGERMTFTLAQLLHAAVTESDNTAVDALIRVLGGPQALTTFLHQHGLAQMTVRDDERGMAQRLDESGYQAFLAAPPNVTTPNTSALFLKKLWQRQLLSPASTQYLLDLMYAQTVPRRLRAGVPADACVANKTGTAGVDDKTAAWNDMGLITWPDGQAVIIAGYLSDTSATQAERDQLFAELARLVTRSVRPQ